MTIIEVNHLTKEYRLGALHNFKHTLRDIGARLRGQKVPKPERFKALDDVNFKVEEGEVVGIIGHNGAGKSTLLKHLAGITTPTRGSVSVRGKVAPLIEVGAGLIGDLTGRENIYLNGSILGLSRREIDKKLDGIVAFAELEQFIDTPIKRYSSGMSVRLGFSIATSVEADILIVDEVLAVGDLAFQRKCFDRIEEIIKRQGKTVLLVSHNIRQVERLCSRTILMDHGAILLDDSSKSACNAYYDLSDKKIYEKKANADSFSERVISSGDVELQSVQIFGSDDRIISAIEYMQDVKFKITYQIKSNIAEPVFGVGIHTTDFLYLATNQSIGHLQIKNLNPGIHVLVYKINKFPILPGVYSLRLGVALGGSFQPIFYSENVIPIHVVNNNISRSITASGKDGFIDFNGEWELEYDAATSDGC